MKRLLLFLLLPLSALGQVGLTSKNLSTNYFQFLTNVSPYQVIINTNTNSAASTWVSNIAFSSGGPQVWTNAQTDIRLTGDPQPQYQLSELSAGSPQIRVTSTNTSSTAHVDAANQFGEFQASFTGISNTYNAEMYAAEGVSVLEFDYAGVNKTLLDPGQDNGDAPYVFDTGGAALTTGTNHSVFRLGGVDRFKLEGNPTADLYWGNNATVGWRPSTTNGTAGQMIVQGGGNPMQLYFANVPTAGITGGATNFATTNTDNGLTNAINSIATNFTTTAAFTNEIKDISTNVALNTISNQIPNFINGSTNRVAIFSPNTNTMGNSQTIQSATNQWDFGLPLSGVKTNSWTNHFFGPYNGTTNFVALQLVSSAGMASPPAGASEFAQIRTVQGSSNVSQSFPIDFQNAWRMNNMSNSPGGFAAGELFPIFDQIIDFGDTSHQMRNVSVGGQILVNSTGTAPSYNRVGGGGVDIGTSGVIDFWQDNSGTMARFDQRNSIRELNMEANYVAFGTATTVVQAYLGNGNAIGRVQVGTNNSVRAVPQGGLIGGPRGVGADIFGGDMTVYGGISTGTNNSGNLYFATSGTNTASSSSPNGLTNRMEIDQQTGNVTIYSNLTVNGTTTLPTIGATSLNVNTLTVTNPDNTVWITSSLGSGTNTSLTGATNYGSVGRTNFVFIDPNGWHMTNNSAANQGVNITKGNTTNDGNIKALATPGFIGDGSGLTGVAASNIVSGGVIANAALVSTVLTNGLIFVPDNTSSEMVIGGPEVNIFIDENVNTMTINGDTTVNSSLTSVAGTRTFAHNSSHTVITNTTTLTSSEWTAGTQKEWYNGATTITIDKTNGNITMKGAKITNPTNASTIVNLGLDANGNMSTNASAIGGSGGGATTVTQTNIPLGTVWTNGSQAGDFSIKTWLHLATVSGVAEVDLMVDQSGGNTFTKLDACAIDTGVTTISEDYTNCSLIGKLKASATLYTTNTSTGTGNTGGVLSGTGQFITISSGTNGAAGATGAAGAQGPAGPSSVFPYLIPQKFWLAWYAVGASAFRLINASGPGTQTGSTAATSSTGSSVRIATTGTINTGVDAPEGGSTTLTTNSLSFYTTVAITNTSNVRVWLAVSSSTALKTVQSPTSQATVGFRYSTNSANWFFVTCNGSTQNATDTSVAADTSFHTYSMTNDASGNYYGFIDGVVKATNTMSGCTVAMLPIISIFDTEGVVKEVRCKVMYAECVQ